MRRCSALKPRYAPYQDIQQEHNQRAQCEPWPQRSRRDAAVAALREDLIAFRREHAAGLFAQRAQQCIVRRQHTILVGPWITERARAELCEIALDDATAFQHFESIGLAAA